MPKATLIKTIGPENEIKVEKRANGTTRVSKSFVIKKDDKKRIINPRAVSNTDQAQKEDTDINKIVAKIEKGGFINTLDERQAIYGDFTSGDDYHDHMVRVARFNEDFEKFPASIKDKFNQDPGQLIDYLNECQADPKLREEAVKLGLLPKPKITREIVDNGDGTKVVQHLRDGVKFDETPYKAPVEPDKAPPA